MPHVAVQNCGIRNQNVYSAQLWDNQWIDKTIKLVKLFVITIRKE